MIEVSISVLVIVAVIIRLVVYYYKDEPPLFQAERQAEDLPSYTPPEHLPMFFFTAESVPSEPPPVYSHGDPD
jgi:hypothetical protein